MEATRAYHWFYAYIRFTCKKSNFWAELPWYLSKNTFFFHCTPCTIFWRPPHTTPRCRFFSNSRSREIRADFKIVKNWKIKTEISKGGFWLNNFYMPLLLHLIFHQKREKKRFFPSSVSRMSLVICKVSWRQKTDSDVDVDNKLRNLKWNCKDQKDLEATLSRKSKQFLLKLVSRKKIILDFRNHWAHRVSRNAFIYRIKYLDYK